MFVDVCFPKNNEEKFIDIAVKLGTKGLLFLYDSEKKFKKVKNPEIKLYYGIISEKNKRVKENILLTPLSRNASKSKKQHFFYDGRYGNKKFHYPADVSQVVMKEVKVKNKSVGFSFSDIFQKDAAVIERISFIIKLCRKYKVNMFAASFADTPYMLRSETELRSLFRVMGMDTKNIKDSFDNLSKRLE